MALYDPPAGAVYPNQQPNFYYGLPPQQTWSWPSTTWTYTHEYVGKHRV